MKHEHKDLSEMTTEELREKMKSGKTVSWFLAGVVVALSALSCYQYLKTGAFTILAMIPVVSLIIVVLTLANIKKIKQELAKRGE